MNWNVLFKVIEAIAIACIPIINFLGIKKFLDSYMEEKGKNLATKEDIQELTSLTEEIKMVYQSKQYINEHIYDIKLATIQESLDFLDDYLSWMSFDSGVVPIRDEKTTNKTLTLRARKCYNNLILTCDSIELSDIFCKILFDNPSRVLELYNEYRNCARNEMGIESRLELSDENVFISRISTKDIEKGDLCSRVV